MMRWRQTYLLLAAVALYGCGGSRTAASNPGAEPSERQDSASARYADSEAVLNFYTWTNYIAPDTVQQFENETGIKVNYQTYDNDEELETKMLVGNTNYDVVIPSGPFFARLLKAAVYRKLDKAELPNLRNLDPAIVKRMAMYDPGNRYAVPYLWNTTGIAYNAEKVGKRLGSVKLDSWALVFDPAIASKLQDCGIAFVDSPIEVTASASMYLGLDPQRLAPQDLAAASEVLLKIRPFVRYTSATRITNDLASGAICIAIAWSGDAAAAHEHAQSAGDKIHVTYVIPKEGGLISVDMMTILANAPHPHNAARWLNYMMRPDVMARITNYTKYPNGNLASLALIDSAIKSDTNIYPDPTTQTRLTDSILATPEYSLLVNREWAHFRTKD